MTEQEFLERFGSGLNDAQKEAVCSADGAILLLAVPGSGKTTVLVTRLGYLIHCRGIAPERILTMTYTVAATKEMRSRFSRQFGRELGDAMEFRTINGLSQRIIDYCSRTSGRPAFRLQENDGELARLVREIYRTVNEDYPTDSTIRDIRTAITYIKNRMLTDEEIEKLDVGVKDLPKIYGAYCQALREARMMDFDDQLQYALTILQKYPAVLNHFQEQYPYLCVDESQDTSKIQHEIIRLLASRSGNIFMVGDEDQSIYGFRAAYPDALVHFEENYKNARVLMMEENYRSTAQIIGAANDFVSRNLFRHPKKIRCTCGIGKPVQVIRVRDREAQYRYLFELARDCREQTAILFRNNDSAVPLIDMLERSGIPYNCRQFDEVFFSHRVVKDLEDIIRFAEDPADTERFLRIYYKLGCSISKKAAAYACDRSARSGRSVLKELLGFPEMKPGLRRSVEDLQEEFRGLPSDTASGALKRILSSMGYKEYLERNRLDTGKVGILDMLGRDIPSAMGLLDRLEELRMRIQEHRDSPRNHFLLSTIHSSKGLEYEQVYLLDVFDGILPALTRAEAKSDEEIRQYQEERRLYYVAMTRAKGRLSLFRSDTEPSEFTDEMVKRLETEQFEPLDYLAFLKKKALGMTYRHESHGNGTIIAQAEEDLLIEFPGNVVKRMTLGEMLSGRERKFGPPEREIPEKKGKKAEKTTPPKKPVTIGEGTRVKHFTFGTGTVEKMKIETMTIHFDDGITRTFLKSSVLPNGKVKMLEK